MARDRNQEFFDEMAAEWGTDVLDLGCGMGVLFDLLRRRVREEGTVTGIDFSFQMARVAHRNFAFANVNVVDADASAPPFRDSMFDMGVAFAAFAHFVDQQKVLDEADRVLKPGAEFHVIHRISSKELSELHRQIGDVVEHDALPSGSKMRQMFDTDHFTDVRIDNRSSLYPASAMNTK